MTNSSSQPSHGWVLVTGASSGIGLAIVRELHAHGFGVFPAVRSVQLARELEIELGSFCHAVVFDLCDPAAIEHARDSISQHLDGKLLAGLVNNAGMAVGGPWQYLNIMEYRQQLEVNLIGPLQVVQAFLPLLGAQETLRINQRPGRIVNISSVSGLIAYPFIGPYAVSKHGMEAFSDSLRRELMIWGIDVITIGPGTVATPIWEKARTTILTPYQDTIYAQAMQKTFQGASQNSHSAMDAAKIGRRVRIALASAFPRVRYSPVQHRLASWTIPRLLPKRLFDRIIALVLGIQRLR